MSAIDPLGGVSALLRQATTAAVAPAGAGVGSPAAPGQIGGTGGVGNVGGVGGTADAAGAGTSFLDSLGDALGSLNTQLNTADAAMTSFASGGSADLHSVMLELQQASIGLKTGIAVRDKLLEAYQELMRLQV